MNKKAMNNKATKLLDQHFCPAVDTRYERKGTLPGKVSV